MNFGDPRFPTSASDRRSDSQGRRASEPTPDIIALETAAEALARFGDISNAIALWAIVLRLRQEAKCPVT